VSCWNGVDHLVAVHAFFVLFPSPLLCASCVCLKFVPPISEHVQSCFNIAADSTDDIGNVR